MDKIEKKIRRKALTELNKIYKPLRKRFNVKLGLRLNDTHAEIFCIDIERNELVFGADVDISRKFTWVSVDEKTVEIELNHGSLGSYNPLDNTNGAALGNLIAITIMKWEKIVPIMDKAFEEYEEAFPRD
jgi:hypothetical protein